MSRKYDHSPKRKQTDRALTSNQQEWKHQVTNLKRRIKELEALGAIVDFVVPDMPKKVTKAAIEKIKEIKRAELLKHAHQVNDEGELVDFEPPKRGETKKRKEEVKQKSKADDPIDIVEVELYNLYYFIQTYTNPNANQSTLTGAKNQLLDMLNIAIEQFGKREIAIRAENMSNAYGFAQMAMDDSNSDRQANYIQGFSNVLFGRSFTLAELISIQREREYGEGFQEVE